ncbi:MAG: polyprenyl synthetase family protein [Selenomonadaceae bacterium]|nr:polyprenyl synthetase family protein [Selenomonadaceae bacterium]
MITEMKLMFNELWKKRIRLIEDEILLELNRTNSIDQTLMDAMKYSLMSGGKRIRPILLMAAADAVNGSGDKFVTTASAIEMVHTYSLIHDDLPAMDNDDYRRGKLTNHKVYGEAMAILAGDALLTLAFEVMLRQRGVNHASILFVIDEISQAIGAAGMVGGQAIDILSTGKKIDLETLRKMHIGKTGALFRAAIKSGAILAGASSKQLQALGKYAENFGLVFQITDDILDVIGDEKTVGKPIGSDERNQKSTYVTLTSLEEAKRLANETKEEAIENLSIFGTEADFLRELVQFLMTRKN